MNWFKGMGGMVLGILLSALLTTAAMAHHAERSVLYLTGQDTNLTAGAGVSTMSATADLIADPALDRGDGAILSAISHLSVIVSLSPRDLAPDMVFAMHQHDGVPDMTTGTRDNVGDARPGYLGTAVQARQFLNRRSRAPERVWRGGVHVGAPA